MVDNFDIEQMNLSSEQYEAARRFSEENEYLIPDKLKSDFKRWDAYVPSSISLNDISYDQFISLIAKYGINGVAPHPIYNDGNLSISEFLSYEEASLFPIQNHFCVCNSENQFMKYKGQGYRIFLICDKSKLMSDDKMRIALMIAKSGKLAFWDADDMACGITSNAQSDIWNYVNSLPQKARSALHKLMKTNESKLNKNIIINRLTESQIRQIVAESVKNVLKEGAAYEDERVYQIMSQAFNELRKAYYRLRNIQDSKYFNEAERVIHDALTPFYENGFAVFGTSNEEPSYMDGAGIEY